MTPIQLALIGPPRLTREEERVSLPTRKALALLAYLALEQAPHSRDSLIVCFWPELDSTRGRAALRRELSRLNKALGAGWVEAVGETVQITPLVQVDVLRWQRQFGINSLELLQTAVTESSGEFMAGFGLPYAPAFDAWQQRQALAWQLARQQALYKMAVRLAEDGDWATAVATARELVETDPLAEEAQRLLMRLLAQSGQRPAALQQYEALEHLLRTELNTPPSPKTAALAEQIRSGTALLVADTLTLLPGRSLRHLWWALGVLVLLFVLAGVGLWQNRAQVQVAQARQLIAESQAAPELAEKLRLVLAANSQVDNFETQAALLDALSHFPPHLVALLPHETAVTALALDESSRTLATGTTSGHIQLWDTGSYTPLAEPWQQHDGRITELLLAADGRLLISSSLDGEVRLWDVDEEKAVGTVHHPTGHIKALQMHANGRWLFSGGSDGQIAVWDVGQAGQNPAMLLPPKTAHDEAVSSLLLLDDGETLLSAGWDGAVRIWQFSEARGLVLLATTQHHTDFVNRLAAVPGGERPFTGYGSAGRDGAIIWQRDVLLQEPLMLAARHTGWVEALVYHHGFYSGGRDGLILWHAPNAEAGLLAQRNAAIWDLAVGAQSGLLYAAEDGGQVSVWHTLPANDAATWIRPYAQQLLVGGNVAGVAFIQDDRLQVSLVDGSVAEITHWTTHARLTCCQQRPGTAAAELQVTTADGRLVVTASGTELRLITGNKRTLYRLPQRITALQLDAQETLLAVGLADGTVHLFNSKGSALTAVSSPWTGHTEPVLSLAFSADGRLLASGSWDGTIRLWEVESGQSLQLNAHERGVAALAFSGDGRFLASGSWDDTVIIWSLSPEAWRAAAQRLSPILSR